VLIWLESPELLLKRRRSIPQIGFCKEGEEETAAAAAAV